MSRKHEIRLGIIGLGMMGIEHIRGYDVVPRCSIVAIADPDEKRLQRALSEFTIERSFTDYRDILSLDDLDGVIVCSPPFSHEEITIAAIAAGKHVLCEKPLALTPSGAQKIARRAKRAGVLVGSCSSRFRFSPTVLKAKEILNAGDLGDVYHVRMSGVSRRNRPGIDYHTSALWNLDKDLAGGGALMDWGIYDLNILFSLFPDMAIKRVDGFCFQGVDEPDIGDSVFNVEEHGGALMRCADGMTISWERSWAAHMNRRPCIRIYGSRAGLAFNPVLWSKDAYFEIYEDRSGKPVTIVPDTDFSGWGVHINLALDFADAIAKKRPQATPVEEEAKFLEIIYAVYRSHYKKTGVNL